MPQPTGTPLETCRSPFVARLVADVKLNGLMDSMQAAGVVASTDTLESMHALRSQIDDRMRRIAADIPRTLPAGQAASAPPSPAVQSLLSELQVLITRLDCLQGAMPGPATPRENPPCN